MAALNYDCLTRKIPNLDLLYYFLLKLVLNATRTSFYLFFSKFTDSHKLILSLFIHALNSCLVCLSLVRLRHREG